MAYIYITELAKAFGYSENRVVNYKPIVRHSEPLPYNRWEFNFVTPKFFYASISFVQFWDEDDYVVQKFMPDGADSDFSSIDRWDKKAGGIGGVVKNHGEALPQSLLVCWDSVIDKKTYQTKFIFTPDVRKLMREPSAGHLIKDRIFYRDTLFIGLAPGGTAKAWLRGYSKNNGNNMLVSTGESVSGDKMTVCQDKTKHPDGYGEYSEEIKSFIKGKEYPYGEW
ncbi:DUF2931 family protein [Xenorhabdus kozodoii]|uniref:DUF2931 family protein n=1 Tax=Xenorhabdus kozodoii TaxID=351676 RepID=A0A2D0LFH9_9GAMM|nr:DUF2931 family protein [Xenorhabdus kozodoii]PHM74448.1 hypothetical protein Xkoz_01002 [Xenorhabdus kozodoii]